MLAQGPLHDITGNADHAFSSGAPRARSMARTPIKQVGKDKAIPPTPENSRRSRERVVVPTFDGEINATYDDLGTSARSYVRQVNTWWMTRLSPDQQALGLP